MLGARHHGRALALVAVLLSLATARAQAHPPAVLRTLVAPPAQDTVTATVQSVRENGIAVITGVQFALKLTFIAVDSTSAIRKGGAAVALADLQPGDLVTVRYRETEAGKVAEAIVVEPPRRQGGGT